MRLGFLGLGIMGEPMARNVLGTGCELRVWNRTTDKCAALEAEGATVCADPGEVCASSDITFAMLADPAAAREVFAAARCGLGAGHDYVDMSTVDDSTSKALSAATAEAGARFLEAPVSGSRKPAEDGNLVILAAGDRSLCDDAASALDAMGKRTVFVGEGGQAARMKLVVNMIMGCMMTAFGEGLALAGRGGLDPAVLLDVLAAGAVANPMFTIKGPTILAGKFAPAFPLKHMQKDLRLALELGDELAQPLPTAAAANASFIGARQADFADEDFSAVCKVLGVG